MMKNLWTPVLIILLMTGCAGPVQQNINDLATPTPNKIEQPLPQPVQPPQGDLTPMNPSANLETVIEAAKTDLAQTLSISSEKIVLVEAKEVTWSDASLGCPQPDMLYAQVLTPGTLVKLQYEGTDYEYHGGTRGALTLCKNPLPPIEGTPGDV